MAALHDMYGNKSFKSSDVFAVYTKVSACKRGSGACTTKRELAVYDALESVLGSKRVDAKAFGYWARRVKGAHTGGFLLDTQPDPATNTNDITVRKT
jgi:hypothetical protein